MPEERFVEHGRDGDIHVLRIANPPVNTLRTGVRAGLHAGIEACLKEGARAIVLIGDGRMFSAGAEMTEFTKPRQPPSLPEVFDAIESSRVPVIAAIHGSALGGGLELALACTFRLATPRAKMGLPEIKLGLIPGYGGTQRLPRLVGEARALDIILSGRTVDAAEAERIGLVNRIVDGDDPAAIGRDYARQFTGYSLCASLFAREAVQRALAVPLADGLRIESDLSTLAYQTADAREGMQAFVEKRPPIFKDH